jgi:hypothetical protein
MILVVSEREIMELSLWRSRSLKLLSPGMFPSFADIQLNVTSICTQVSRLRAHSDLFFVTYRTIGPLDSTSPSLQPEISSVASPS